MIIKSSSRAGAKDLADHLTNTQDNEKVRVTQSRGLLVTSVHEALDDMQDFAHAAPKCRKPLFHVSMNPPTRLSESEWLKAWVTLENELNLGGQPFIEVEHQKYDRCHRHRVYSRITEAGKALLLSHTYARQEKVARKLEYTFGYPLTPGRHNKAVLHWLKKDGDTEVAEWMRQQQAHHRNRPKSGLSRKERQQEKRTNVTIKKVRQDLQAVWQNTNTGAAFMQGILQHGYILARGDRRDVVILDATDSVHSPRRRIGVRATEIRKRFSDILDALPTISQVREARVPREVTPSTEQMQWIQKYAAFLNDEKR